MTTAQARITALHPDMQTFGKLSLGELREFMTKCEHLPDSTQVLYPGKDTQGIWNKPMSGGLLEVIEYAALDGTTYRPRTLDAIP